MNLTRKTAHRGMNVTVTFKDGTTGNGALTAWGPQVLRLLVNDRGRVRTVEVHHVSIDHVTEACEFCFILGHKGPCDAHATKAAETVSQAPATQAEIDKMTFDMYVDCGLNAAATARQMGCSASTVRARVGRHSLAASHAEYVARQEADQHLQDTHGPIVTRHDLDAAEADHAAKCQTETTEPTETAERQTFGHCVKCGWIFAGPNRVDHCGSPAACAKRQADPSRQADKRADHALWMHAQLVEAGIAKPAGPFPCC